MVGMGFKNSPLHLFSKPSSSIPTSYNPFDSDDEADKQLGHFPATIPPSKPTSNTLNSSWTNPFGDDDDDDDDDDDGGHECVQDRARAVTSSGSKYSLTYEQRNRYDNDFRDSGGVQNQSVEDLENYAVYKAEETTKTVNHSLRIAEEIREDATQTLITLHHQGEQITRTHEEAVNIAYHLTRGEKLLGSLGGIFSKRWKPKWTRPIKGPTTMRDDPVSSKGNLLEQREKLGLTPLSNGRPKSQTPPEPTNALQKIEVEKMKQDDALSDLSNLLGELKVMAVDMGTEINRHNKALEHVDHDVGVLNERVEYANRRARQLLRK